MSLGRELVGKFHAGFDGSAPCGSHIGRNLFGECRGEVTVAVRCIAF